MIPSRENKNLAVKSMEAITLTSISGKTLTQFVLGGHNNISLQTNCLKSSKLKKIYST